MAMNLLRPLALNNGHLMPRLGIGTYQILGDQCEEIVQRAVQIGYRHIDTAQLYQNEQNVGSAVARLEKSNACKRNQLFITSKLAHANHLPKFVHQSVEESLEKLKTKYLDLLLIHSPWSLKNKGDSGITLFDAPLEYDQCNLKETWSAFETLVKDGKCRSIGLSNFTKEQIGQIISSCKIKPQNVQFECHAYYQQNQLRPFLQNNGISCTAYSPLGAPARPTRHHTEDNKDILLLENPVVQEIAGKHNVPPALVLIRFLLQRDMIVVPKTQTVHRLEENLKVLNFELEESDVRKLKSIDKGLRFFAFLLFQGHPDFPKNGEPF